MSRYPGRRIGSAKIASTLLFAYLTAGCDESGGGADGTGGSGGSAAGGGTGGTGGSGADGADCTESQLFAPRTFGADGEDIIRDVEVDETARDVYFITTDELFVVRADSGEATRLAGLPSAGSNLWLTDDSILVPGLIPYGSMDSTVLLATDRDGSNVRVVVPLPTAASINWLHTARKVQVVGDNVFWIGVDRYTDDPADLSPEYQFTYAVRRTSWRSPGTPEDIYSTDRELDGLIIAGGKLVIEEEVGEVQSFTYEQKVIDPQTGELDPTPAFDRYSGEVVDGDEAQLVVSRLDLDDLATIGTYRVAPTGGTGERLSDNAFIQNLGFREKLWVFTDTPAPNATTLVKAQMSARPVETIGCIRGGAVDFDTWVGPSEALIAIERDFAGTILRFEL